MKKSNITILLTFILLTLVFAFWQTIMIDKFQTLTQADIDTINQLEAIDNLHVEVISELQEEVDLLKTQNHIQAVALEQQAEMLTNYDHHIDDLQKELTAYEIALEEAAPMFQLPTTWEGPVLTKEIGGNMGPAGRETYYNLPMQGCINKMRSLGYSEEEYPYWIRDDGAKMLGRYVMIAANWKIRPLGTILETSLGWSIVVDTGDFVADYPYGVDIAVDW